MSDPSTLERIYPSLLSDSDETGQATYQLHLARYAFAGRHLQAADRILDIACGAGYGTNYLCTVAKPSASIVGVDIDRDAIAYAREHYSSERITFVQCDAMTFESDRFDAVVSLETIEHVPDPNGLIERFSHRLLRGRGLLVCSVPVTPSVDANPHHRTDFNSRSFRALLSSHGLEEFDSYEQVQRFNPLAIAARRDARMKDMRSDLLGFYLRHPQKVLLRAVSTLRYGFSNRYLTLACRK